MVAAQVNGRNGSETKTTDVGGHPEGSGFAVVVPEAPEGPEGKGTTIDVVAIPAIGADPKTTWTPYRLHRPEPTKSQEPASSASVWSNILHRTRSVRTEPPVEHPSSMEDIKDEDSNNFRGPWLTNELRKEIPQARVLLYDHGSLKEEDTLEVLAERLLRRLDQERKSGLGFQDRYPGPRPIFFICHSTGGLVAKHALVSANKRTKFASIAEDCYGITFIATPHQGSTYLSSREFWPSIRRVMNLRCDMPDSLMKQFHGGNNELRELAEDFETYSTDLRINTYYETSDSDLAFTPANDNIPRSYHVCITSVGSAILELEQESETPLSCDHMDSATFQGEDDLRTIFIFELRQAVLRAEDLSKIGHYSIDLETDVKIEVNGFFEDATSSVKLWTSRTSLKDYLKKGPRALLEARMRQAQSSANLPSVSPNVPETKQKENRIMPKTSGQPSDRLTAKSTNTKEGDGSTAAYRVDSIDSITFSEPRRHPRLGPVGLASPSDHGPPLPAMETLKLTWVHIPYTHTGWVRQVLGRISEERGLDAHSDFLKEEHWASNHHHGRHAAPHAKFVKSSFVDLDKRVGLQASDTRFAIYLQYLHWDTYERLLERRAVITRRLEQGRVRPIHKNIADSESLESKMIWKARDDDQMLWKRTRPKSSSLATTSSKPHEQNIQDRQTSLESDKLQRTRRFFRKRNRENDDEALQKPGKKAQAKNQGGNVLMVDQLWLWALDEHTVVTFFPKKDPVSSEGRLYQQADLHDGIYNEANSGLQSVPDAETFASLIVQRAVTMLLDRTAHRHLQVLRIYEESISILIERMTKSYKSFRKEGFSVRPDVYNRDKNGAPMNSHQKHQRDMQVERQSKEDFSSLLELRDIYDELHTIMKLFKEQRKTIAFMTMRYKGSNRASEGQNEEQKGDFQNLMRIFEEQQKLILAAIAKQPEGTGRPAENQNAGDGVSAFDLEMLDSQTVNSKDALRYLEEAERSINAFETQILDMIESTENAEKAYSSLLDIKQKQANVDESRLARSQVDATAAQGRAIMLPLSFFTSVFGPISVGVIFFALTLAFSNTIRSSAVVTRKVVVGMGHDVHHLLAWPLGQLRELSCTLYDFTHLSFLQTQISQRYLRQTETYDGKDYDVWEEHAHLLHQSARDETNENSRVLSSRRRSWLSKIQGEKTF
ncbi:MAG: hypothetical protein Q9195_001170 [Heterodermia aff. obscurata]